MSQTDIQTSSAHTVHCFTS